MIDEDMQIKEMQCTVLAILRKQKPQHRLTIQINILQSNVFLLQSTIDANDIDKSEVSQQRELQKLVKMDELFHQRSRFFSRRDKTKENGLRLISENDYNTKPLLKTFNCYKGLTARVHKRLLTFIVSVNLGLQAHCSLEIPLLVIYTATTTYN